MPRQIPMDEGFEVNVGELNSTEISIGGNRYEYHRLFVALIFVLGIMWYMYPASSDSHYGMMLMVSAMIGGYMAMNIGANDVANNVGPAVGSRALTLTGAILIAAVFESAGALIAGGEVVTTIKKGIIDPALLTNRNSFIWLMMAALFAAALWLNIATWFGAPVSTTHSIVGGVLGAGVAAGGWQVANLSQLSAIVASWVISPMLGGIIAAAFLYLIKRQITYQDDKLSSARRVVPLLILLMTWAFSCYLILKGLKKIWKVDFSMALLISLVIAVLIYFMVRPLIAKAASKLANNKQAINQLFTIPLIVAAALLSFAHGANDVANAIGPLAAINDAILNTGGAIIASKASIPLWVMIVGAAGIALGLMLFGPRLIKTVGSEITELDQMRAFCIAMAAAITVLIATQLGLPVSSTHIALGAIFGVGFLREYMKTGYDNMMLDIRQHYVQESQEKLDAFLKRFEQASRNNKSAMLKQLIQRSESKCLSRSERKKLKTYRHVLVKRSALYRIVAAWLVTVPASAIMAAIIFYAITGFMLTSQ